MAGDQTDPREDIRQGERYRQGGQGVTRGRPHV